jgi:hypothetical protein
MKKRYLRRRGEVVEPVAHVRVRDEQLAEDLDAQTHGIVHDATLALAAEDLRHQLLDLLLLRHQDALARGGLRLLQFAQARADRLQR